MKLLPVLPVLILGAASLPAAELKVVETDEAITITRDEIPVLTYHKAEVPPPEGVDPIFKRSGFIHPVCAPNGEPVTGIHPKDHYHHLGIWHAWVKTKHGKDTPDFLNLEGKTGRVRYVQTMAPFNDARDHSFACLMVRREHEAYTSRW